VPKRERTNRGILFTSKIREHGRKKRVCNEYHGGNDTDKRPRYNCEIVETALAGGDRVRICVKGAKEDLDALFDYVNEAGKE
jgi:hypothetical protein